jgi:hypothetical protein
MCTMIAQQVAIDGSGKGTSGWFAVRQASVSYDHPFNAPLEHALNIDFVNEVQGPGARVAVELSAESARALIDTILAVLDRAEAGGFVELPRSPQSITDEVQEPR